MADETTPEAVPAPAETTPAAQADTPAPKEENIADILAYDPFEPKNEPAKEEKVPVEEPKKEEEPKTPAPQEPALTTLLEQILAKQNTAPPAPAPARAEPAKPAPRFNVSVPDDLMVALRSDEPAEARSAMNVLVNSIMNAQWNSMVQHIREEVFPMLKQVVAQHGNQQSEQQRFHDEFYGTYKQYDDPQFKPIVYMAAQALAKELGNAFTGTGADFQKKLAEKLVALGVQGKVAAPPPPTPRPKPFQSGTSGARPALDPKSETSKDIVDVLFG